MIKPQTIWLIGASEGIGRALALQLAQYGHRLIISARNAERLQSLQAEMHSEYHVILPLDVTDTASVTKAWQEIVAQQAWPDCMIYNAGTYDPLTADQFDLGKIEQMIDINLHGALRVLADVIPHFVAQRRGHIALVGSVAGYRGLPGAMGYSSSKAALINLAECLRCDLTKHNIKVQIINPGYVQTRLTAKNNFAMPMMISPENAARIIARQLFKPVFEIRLPWLFTTICKLFQILPNWLYYRLLTQK